MFCCVIVEADDEVEISEPDVSVETRLSIYHQLQTQLFRSVLADATRHHDEAEVRDLVTRFCTLQDRQMKIVAAIQASRYTAEQVNSCYLNCKFLGRIHCSNRCCNCLVFAPS